MNVTGYTGLLTSPEPPRNEIYGGIRKDLQSGSDLLAQKASPSSVQGCADAVDAILKTVVIGAVELPLTFVGDTLTLPLTIEKTLEKMLKQSSQQASP